MIPDQPWLDGFSVRKGLIRQFVAYPMKASRYERLKAKRFDPCKAEAVSCDMPGPMEMGLAPGGMMRQEVYSDDYGFSAWERNVRSRCFVHLLNSGQYRTVTGLAPPYEPPTASDYTEAGLPWFEYFDADLEALEGAPRLDRLDSVGTRRVNEGKPPLDGGEFVQSKPSQIKRLRNSQAVRDGSTAW